VYLDHHATTPTHPDVVAAMLPFFSERFGNPSSRAHAMGQEAHAAVETARAEVGALIGAAPEDIVFTSGATEADNLAVRGVALAARDRGRHVVTTAIEHSAVLEPCRTLEREGFAVTRVDPGPEGLVDPDDVLRALRPDTVLVSVMAANNEVGMLQPVAAVAALCRERGVALHTDAVQLVGHLPVEVDGLGADLVSLSAHKMYGPKGVGALYVRRGRRPRLRLAAQAEGGGQEKRLRAGTLNVPAIVGFGVAARLARAALGAGDPDRVASLRDRLLAGLVRRIEGVLLNGAAVPRLPGNLSVSIARAPAEILLLAAGDRVAFSSGAACAEDDGKGSHVLRAMGLSDERVQTSVRFGVGRGNTEKDIDAAVEIVAQAVAEARQRSASAAH
jgi:cysteine desulfurase